MLLNAEKMQEFLARALFGEAWKENAKFIVHRQGNLINAQQMYNSDAFFTYYTSLFEKKLINPTPTRNTHTADIVFSLHLQCIGKNAEKHMLTTLFWDERTDIETWLAELDCTLLETPRTIISTPYFQDGANTILSYETVFKISCALTITDEVTPMPNLILEGGLKYEFTKEN